MILAAGLTPAWQQIVSLERLRPGAVNRAARVAWCASGKSINVAVALHHLQSPAQSLALVGGEAGSAIRAELERMHLSACWIETASPTRVCTTIVERNGTTTELVENAGPVANRELEAFREAYLRLAADAQLVVLSGSLPPPAASDFYARLLADTRCPALLDARGPELLSALNRRPLVVKPNREELQATLDMPTESDQALLAAMRELNARGAQWVVVTDGPRALWMTSSDQAYRIAPPSIQPVNAIGSGDCLAAGIALGLVRGETLPDAVRLGVACAIENALVLLPARLDAARALARRDRLVCEVVSVSERN